MYILRARPQAWNARPGMLGLGPFRPSSAWYIFVLRRRARDRASRVAPPVSSVSRARERAPPSPSHWPPCAWAIGVSHV